MKLGLTAMRVAVGSVFFAHGAQKLFGWFGGHGLDATAQGFESMGLKPGRRNAIVSGVSEAAGGALLALGFLTPLASAALLGVMSEAVRAVHWDKGFFAAEGGYEFNLVLAASAFALADVGPGELSVDQALGLDLHGPMWALFALGAGLAGPRLLEKAAPESTPTPATPPERAPEAVQATAA